MRLTTAATTIILACTCSIASATPPKQPAATPTQPKVTMQNTCTYDEQAQRIEASFITSGPMVWRISCFGERCSVVAIDLGNIEAGRPMAGSDVVDYNKISLQAEHTAQKMASSTGTEAQKFRMDLQEIAVRSRPFVTRHPGMAVVSVPPRLSFVIEPRGLVIARVHDANTEITHREPIQCLGSTTIADQGPVAR
jgi:hypothetical protein